MGTAELAPTKSKNPSITPHNIALTKIKDAIDVKAMASFFET